MKIRLYDAQKTAAGTDRAAAARCIISGGDTHNDALCGAHKRPRRRDSGGLRGAACCCCCCTTYSSSCSPDCIFNSFAYLGPLPRDKLLGGPARRVLSLLLVYLAHATAALAVPYLLAANAAPLRNLLPPAKKCTAACTTCPSTPPPTPESRLVGTIGGSSRRRRLGRGSAARFFPLFLLQSRLPTVGCWLGIAGNELNVSFVILKAVRQNCLFFTYAESIL